MIIIFIDGAVDRVRFGTGSRGQVLSESERLRIAVHETAHAVVATATGAEVEKVPPSAAATSSAG